MTFPSGRLLRNISIAVRPVVRHGWYSDTSMTRSPPVGRLSPGTFIASVPQRSLGEAQAPQHRKPEEFEDSASLLSAAQWLTR